MRITRLCLVLFVLMTATLSAKPHKGGSVLPFKAAGNFWFYCYDQPEVINVCDGSGCECAADCEAICGSPCDGAEDYCLD